MRLVLTISCIVILLLCITGFIFYGNMQENQSPKACIVSEQVCKKTINHAIQAQGVLELAHSLKIGSLVCGIVKNIYVEENAPVSKGQILADIDTGCGTTEYDKAKLLVAQAQEEYTYLKKNYDRMAALYESGELAQDTFEKIKKETAKSKLELAIANIEFTKQEINLANRTIKAPESGIISMVYISQGEGITGGIGGAMPLFELAANVTTMQAKIDIDENDICFIHEGKPVTLTINTYPDDPIESTIKSVSFSPRINKDASTGSNVSYRALVILPNNNKKLRPGMGLTASITISSSEDALCIKNLALEINEQHLIAAAKINNKTLKPLSALEKKLFKSQNKGLPAKFIWIENNTTITETGIIIGALDDTHVHVTKGLTTKDLVITNVSEPIQQKSMSTRLFSRT